MTHLLGVGLDAPGGLRSRTRGAGLGAFNAFIWSLVCRSKVVVCISDYACKTLLFQFLAVRNYSEIEYSAVEEYIAMSGYIASLANLPNYSKTSNASCCDMSASAVGSFNAERSGVTNVENGLDNSKSKKSYNDYQLNYQRPLGPTAYARLRQRDRERESSGIA